MHPHQELGITFGQLGKQLGTEASLNYSAAEFVKMRKRLRVTPEELVALLGAREMLERGMIEDGQGAQEATGHDQHLFNMNRTCSVKGCGTVSCIGGTMALIMGLNAYDADEYVTCSTGESRKYENDDYPVNHPHSDSLQGLFYPEIGEAAAVMSWDDITPEQAVVAIDNFLKDGDPQWEDVVQGAVAGSFAPVDRPI